MNKEFKDIIIAGGYFLSALGGLSTSLLSGALWDAIFMAVLAAIGFPVAWKSFQALRGKGEDKKEE